MVQDAVIRCLVTPKPKDNSSQTQKSRKSPDLRKWNQHFLPFLIKNVSTLRIVVDICCVDTVMDWSIVAALQNVTTRF